MASGLQDEVRRALTGNNHLAVVDVQHAFEPTPADFVMEGSVRCVDGSALEFMTGCLTGYLRTL